MSPRGFTTQKTNNDKYLIHLEFHQSVYDLSPY
jgi:hypothetical protein